MSHVSERGLRQTVTWWRRTGSDGYGGDTVDAPVTINARWSDKSEQYVSKLDNKEVVSRAVVHVDRDVSVGDWLYEGTSAELTPWTVEGAYKVRAFKKVPNLRNLLITRKAWL